MGHGCARAVAHTQAHPMALSLRMPSCVPLMAAPQGCPYASGSMQYNFRRLPPHHKALLTPQQQNKFAAMRSAIEANHFFVQSLLEAFDPEAAQVRPAAAQPNLRRGVTMQVRSWG